jgi:hypothetical protein
MKNVTDSNDFNRRTATTNDQKETSSQKARGEKECAVWLSRFMDG